MPTYNKITLNGTTLIDLSTDTVAVADDITSGKVGHLNTGASATGTAQILDTSDATATSSDILSPKTAYVNGSKITGSITSKTAQTYTPTTTNQTISSGQYLSGTQTIVGDANLVSANIASGVSIFGVAGSHSGGGGSASDPVRFLDYDGTVLYSYSAEDFANLSALPANPVHTGLTAQGWNWTLANAKTYVADCGMLDIGQLYRTDDRKTRIYISLVDSARLSPYLGICPDGTVVVDWGDNSTTDTLTGTSITTVQRAQHTYATTGDYVITLTVSSGRFQIYGSNSSTNGSYLLTRTDGDDNSQKCYQNAIQKVELGSSAYIGDYAFGNCHSLTSITIPSEGMTIGDYAFNNCYSLTSITIPSLGTTIGDYTFNYCYSLTSITIPRGTSIGGSAFYNCYSLARVTIPSGVTSISFSTFKFCYSLARVTIPSGVTDISSDVFYNCASLASITIPSGVPYINNNMFSNCYSLASITIPSSVTSIGGTAFCYCRSLSSITIPSKVTSISALAFSNCSCVAEYHLLPTTPPTLKNSNAFNGILSDCKIYVPAASLSAYQTATNWSTYASYMVGE